MPLPDPAASIGSDAVAKELLWAFARDVTPYAIVVLAPDGVATWANAGAESILGAPAEDIVGRSLRRFFTAEDIRLGIPEHELDVAIHHGAADDNRWMVRADGSPFWASGATTAVRGAGGEAVALVKILRNRTDEKMRITTLENRAHALAGADEAKTAAIATISHELRNPLASLSMAAEMLHRLCPAADPRLRMPLAVLERNVGFATRLVSDLQDASRAGAGKLALQPELLHLDEVLETAVATAFDQAGHPPRRFDLLLPPGEPILLHGDRLRLQQVFVNLVGNAIKYTAEGGCIWVRASAQSDWVVVRVEDDGIGIAPHMLERIFHMFTQASTPMAGAGLGIGLALVKEITELHGGSVQANSHGIDRGCEVTVRLPTRVPVAD